MPAEAASWHCSSDLSSSQEPQGVVRQKVMNKHLQGPGCFWGKGLNSELQIGLIYNLRKVKNSR